MPSESKMGRTTSTKRSCMAINQKLIWVKKEGIWLSPMTKAPAPTEKSKKQHENMNIKLTEVLFVCMLARREY